MRALGAGQRPRVFPLDFDLHGRRQTLPWDYFRAARHPRRTPEIPAQQLSFLEKRALQLFHSDDVSCHGHLVMTSELRGWGKLGITLRDEFLPPPRYYK